MDINLEFSTKKMIKIGKTIGFEQRNNDLFIVGIGLDEITPAK